MISDPEVSGASQRFLIEVSLLSTAKWKRAAHGKLLISTDPYLDFEYSDLVVFSGKLRLVDEEGKGSYAFYLWKDRVFAELPFALLVKKEVGWSVFWKPVYRFKKTLLRQVEEIFNYPASALVAGLLIGARQSIPKDIIDAYRTTGLTHILAVSGFNITLIINFAILFLAPFAKRYRILMMVVMIFLFVSLVGFSASVVRAALMGVLMLFADFFERKARIFECAFNERCDHGFFKSAYFGVRSFFSIVICGDLGFGRCDATF